VSLWRQWPSWIVLLCLGLMLAAEASCFAQFAATPLAPAAQKVEPERSKPATKKGSLLGAIVVAITVLIGAAGSRDVYRVTPLAMLRTE